MMKSPGLCYRFRLEKRNLAVKIQGNGEQRRRIKLSCWWYLYRMGNWAADVG